MGVIKINGVTYGGGDNSVMLTQAEYDALVEAGTVDPTVLYMITDKNSENTAYAATVSYANTDSGLAATNVQGAIDEVATVKSNIGNIDNVDLTSVQAGDLMQWQSVGGVLKLVPYNLFAQTDVTVTYIQSIIDGHGNTWAYTMGNLFMITGYMKSTSALSSDTVIGTISNVSLKKVLFVSSVGSSGSTLRIKLDVDNKITIEKAMPANEWFSYTMVGFLA